MRILVTGGAGFIGSHLTDRLLHDGYHVHVVDDLSAGHTGNLTAALETGRCRLTTADVTQPETVDVVVRWRPELVLHLAAQIDVRVSVADPLRDACVNILGTVNILNAAHKADASKFVNVSSAAIYGNPHSLPVGEETPPNPLSPYAVSKLAAEGYCHQYQQVHGLPTTTVVLTNVYGPRQRPGTGAVATWVQAMCTGQPTVVYGDGNIRDYLYVADAVDALVRAADPSVTAQHVEVGTGIPVVDRQMHDAVAAAVGTRAKPDRLPRRGGDVAAMVVDPATARRVLGWQPRVSLAAGLAATVEHARQRFAHTT